MKTLKLLEIEIKQELKQKKIFKSIFALITMSSGYLLFFKDILIAENSFLLLFWSLNFFIITIVCNKIFDKDFNKNKISILNLCVPIYQIFLSKFLFSLIICFFQSLLLATLFTFFIEEINIWWNFFIITEIATISLTATCSTLAFSTANQKKITMQIILSFPLLLPQLKLVIETTNKIFQNNLFFPKTALLLFLASTFFVVATTTLLSEDIWRDLTK